MFRPSVNPILNMTLSTLGLSEYTDSSRKVFFLQKQNTVLKEATVAMIRVND